MQYHPLSSSAIALVPIITIIQSDQEFHMQKVIAMMSQAQSAEDLVSGLGFGIKLRVWFFLGFGFRVWRVASESVCSGLGVEAEVVLSGTS